MLNYYWNRKSWSLCTDSELGCSNVVCDILIVALSLMSVGIWLVNRYEQNGLFSSWTRCTHNQMETHNNRSGLLDNNSCHRNTWSLCTDSELGGSTRYWVGRSFDATLCWLVDKNTSWAVLLITNALFSFDMARLQSNVDVQSACWTTTETERAGHCAPTQSLAARMWYATSWS